MSDLTATNCGCGCDNGNNGCCSTLIWLLLLTSCCGNGNGLFGGNGCGNDNSCLWLILILCCCGGCGNGGFFGNSGCGCGNGCGCSPTFPAGRNQFFSPPFYNFLYIKEKGQPHWQPYFFIHTSSIFPYIYYKKPEALR